MITKGLINLLHSRSHFKVEDTLSKYSSHQLNYKELIQLSFYFDDHEKKGIQNNVTITLDELEQLPTMYAIVPSQERPSMGSERIHTENGEGVP